MRFLAVIATLALAAPAWADQGFLVVTPPVLALDGVALNDAQAADRTLSVTLTDTNVVTTGRAVYSKLIVTVDFTYAAATTVTAQFTCSLDGTTYGRRTSTSTSAGASTIYAETGTYTTGGASAVLNLEYDVRGCRAVKVLLGGAGAGASDLVDVTWVAVAGS
jgi:hypothetical protein